MPLGPRHRCILACFLGGIVSSCASPPKAAPSADPLPPGRVVLRDVPAATVLCSHHRTSLSRLAELSSSAIPALLRAREAAGLKEAGPPVLTYHGCDGDAEKEFDLGVAIPIEASNSASVPSGFAIETLPAFHAAAVRHLGSMADCKAVYSTVYRQMFFSGHGPTGENREVYPRWDGYLSPATECEIQVGVH